MLPSQDPRKGQCKQGSKHQTLNTTVPLGSKPAEGEQTQGTGAGTPPIMELLVPGASLLPCPKEQENKDYLV